jgi:hypothetical protein
LCSKDWAVEIHHCSLKTTGVVGMLATTMIVVPKSVLLKTSPAPRIWIFLLSGYRYWLIGRIE